jgi:ABC-type glucose/galactose transport system permease subunit
MGAGHGTDPQSRPLYNVQRRDAIFAHLEAAKSLLSALHLKRFVTTFGGALWFHVMQLMFAFVYAIIEIAAVWAFWNLVSPEKEVQTVRPGLVQV